jgi:dATP pyrophosphohydrolase
VTKIIKAVCAITFDKDSAFHFLILKKKGFWEGWQFMQGGIEKGESEEIAVLRELKEETTLDGTIVKKLDLKSDYWFDWEGERVHKFVTFFLVKADKAKEIKISEEHSEYKWVDYETALKEIKFNKELFVKAYKELKELYK